MLSRVDVTNSRGNVLSLPLEEDDGVYQVADIDGLHPVKASLSSTSYAGVDGEIFQSAKRPARNVKIKLDLDPDFNPKTYTDLRRDLYPFFMPKSQITLRFYLTSGLYLDIVGIVEDMSSPLFEEDPAVDISVMCYQPDFVDARMVTVEGQYQDVRRFIRDVERSRQFVVINEVELQRATQTNAPASIEEGGSAEGGATAAAPSSGSGSRGSLVSLQLNMATYFQRSSVADGVVPSDQE